MEEIKETPEDLEAVITQTDESHREKYTEIIELLKDVMDTYSLDQEVITNILSTSIMKVLSNYDRKIEVQAFINLKDYLKGKEDDVISIYKFYEFMGEFKYQKVKFDNISKKNMRLILLDFKKELDKEKSGQYYSLIKHRIGGLVGGTIKQIKTAENKIIVQPNYEFFKWVPDDYVFIYPTVHQPPKERDNYNIGDYYLFILNSAKFVGNEVQVILNRCTDKLPSAILREEMMNSGVNTDTITLRRFPGVVSYLYSDTQVPKHIIERVRELLGGEYLYVIYDFEEAMAIKEKEQEKRALRTAEKLRIKEAQKMINEAKENINEELGM